MGGTFVSTLVVVIVSACTSLTVHGAKNETSRACTVERMQQAAMRAFVTFEQQVQPCWQRLVRALIGIPYSCRVLHDHATDNRRAPRHYARNQSQATVSQSL